MTANAEHSEKLVSDLKRLVRDSQELLKDSASMAGEKAHDLRDRLSHTLELAKAGYGRFETKAKEGIKATDKLVRRHPYEAVGVALGLGLLIGLLARRK